MKPIAFLCGALLLGACSGQSEFISRTADLPGIPTTINCDPTPEHIFSKTGDLIEVKHPILHPSCHAKAKAAGKAKGETAIRPNVLSWLRFGPPRYKADTTLEAGNDPIVVTRGDSDPVDLGIFSLENTSPADETLPTTDAPTIEETPTGDTSPNPSVTDPETAGPTGSGPVTPEVAATEPSVTEPDPVETATAEPTETETPAQTEEPEPSPTPSTQPSEGGLSKLDQLKEHAGLL